MDKMIQVFKNNNYDEINEYICKFNCWINDKFVFNDKEELLSKNESTILNICSDSIKYFLNAYFHIKMCRFSSNNFNDNFLSVNLEKSLIDDPKNWLAYDILLFRKYRHYDLIIKYYDDSFNHLFNKHNEILCGELFKEYIKIKKENCDLKLKLEFSDLSQLEKEFYS